MYSVCKLGPATWLHSVHEIAVPFSQSPQCSWYWLYTVGDCIITRPAFFQRYVVVGLFSWSEMKAVFNLLSLQLCHGHGARGEGGNQEACEAISEWDIRKEGIQRTPTHEDGEPQKCECSNLPPPPFMSLLLFFPFPSLLPPLTSHSFLLCEDGDVDTDQTIFHHILIHWSAVHIESEVLNHSKLNSSSILVILFSHLIVHVPFVVQ